MRFPKSLPAMTLEPEAAASCIRLAVCSFPGRSAWLYEKKIPYRLYADGLIAAYPRWFHDFSIPEGGGTCAFPVDRGIMEGLSFSEEELLALAEENTRKMDLLMSPLDTVLGPEILPAAGIPVWCVRENASAFGASVILDGCKLEKIYEKFETPYFIIPSSIHEVLVLKEADGDPEALNRIIREVNETEVRPEERLSDSVLYFDGNRLSSCS